MRELGIIAQFRDEAPYLAEWIEYHRTVGVDRFWLYDDGSIDDWRSAISGHTSDGTAEIVQLPDGDPRSPSSTKQRATFRDGLRRAAGSVRWVALIDVDEFLLPMNNATVPACLRQHFERASGVYVNWRMFGTSQATVLPGSPLLSQLTRASLRSHPENSIGKSLVRPERVSVDDLWYTHHFPLAVGSVYLDGGRNELSFGLRNGHSDLLTSGAHLDDHIRINHYNLRDESFFWRNRVGRAYEGELPGKGIDRLREHYESFGKTEDIQILEFLSRHHPMSYHNKWFRRVR